MSYVPLPPAIRAEVEGRLPKLRLHPSPDHKIAVRNVESRLRIPSSLNLYREVQEFTIERAVTADAGSAQDLAEALHLLTLRLTDCLTHACRNHGIAPVLLPLPYNTLGILLAGKGDPSEADRNSLMARTMRDASMRTYGVNVYEGWYIGGMHLDLHRFGDQVREDERLYISANGAARATRRALPVGVMELYRDGIVEVCSTLAGRSRTRPNGEGGYNVFWPVRYMAGIELRMDYELHTQRTVVAVIMTYGALPDTHLPVEVDMVVSEEFATVLMRKGVDRIRASLDAIHHDYLPFRLQISDMYADGFADIVVTRYERTHIGDALVPARLDKVVIPRRRRKVRVNRK